MLVDIKKALGGRFTDEGFFEAAGGSRRRMSVLLPIAVEKGFNCYRVVVHLEQVEPDIYEVARVERFRALCIGCGDDRQERVERMDEAAEKRLREYLEEAL